MVRRLSFSFSTFLGLLPLSLAACSGVSAPAEESVGVASQAIDESDFRPIYKKWKKLGGKSAVGEATSAVETMVETSAKYQLFEKGVIVYSEDFGAVFLKRDLFDAWQDLRGRATVEGADMLRFLGAPVRDFETNADSTEVDFERGVVLLQDGHRRVVYGDVYETYLSLRHVLGLPQADETGLADQSHQVFEKGEIHRDHKLGAFGLWGPILERWKDLGGPSSSVGFPKSHVASIAYPAGHHLGYSARFEDGAIFQKEGSSSAWELSGDLLTNYETKNGGPAGFLGFPIAAPGTASSGDDFADFEGGALVDHKANDSYKGVVALGTFDFFWERVQAEGEDCGNIFCGDRDLYTRVRVDTPAGRLVDAPRPERDGDTYSGAKDLNEAFDLGGLKAKSDLKIDVWMHGKDKDPGHDDEVGRIEHTYSIDNLWGLIESTEHHERNLRAWFRIRNHVPFDPNDKKGQMWWSFQNFSTSHLTYNQFAQTFADVDPEEKWWRHPFNKLLYKIYEGIADGGNCFGMALESIYAETGRSAYNEPIFQFFPDTADGSEPDKSKPAHAALMNEINVKHGYQLGINTIAWTAANFLAGMSHDPKANYFASRDAFVRGDYPLLSITDNYLNGGAHTVRPYEWTTGDCSHADDIAGCFIIKVQDPNVPKGIDAAEDFIEISRTANRYWYKDEYEGGLFIGGRLLWEPFSMLSHVQYTPMANPLELLQNGVLVILGNDGKMNQISDEAGRTFFEPGISGVPTRWDQIRQDDAQRVPDIAPVTIAQKGADVPQIFTTHGNSSTLTYEVVGAPGAPSGRVYEATIESGRLSAHFEIPGTGKPERIRTHGLNTADKAISLEIPEGSQEKRVTWTLAGAEKQRWAELSSLKMVPSQKIALHMENAGYHLVFDNDGPPTSATLRVKAGPKVDPVMVGEVSIPSGHGQIEFELPVTSATLTGEVQGNAGWLLAPVTVNLSAKDYSGTGIASIEYSLDQEVWQTYSGPFLYSREGATRLYYRATDKAHNEEETKSLEIKIDTRQPTATGSVSTQGGIKLQFSEQDPMPGSDVAGVHTSVENPNGGTTLGFTGGRSGTIALPTTCSAVEFWGEDVAGNQQSPHVMIPDSSPPVFVSVPATLNTTHCTSAAGLMLGTPVVKDDCRGAITVSNDAPAKFMLGATIVTWRAQDLAGNVATATQKVITSLGDDPSCCPVGSNIIMGSTGPDRLIGTAGSDCIIGLAGDDQIEGLGGDDFMSGGDGNENITGGDNADLIWGGNGLDVIDSQGGNDYIDGGGNWDSCSGGTGVDAIGHCELSAFCTAACCSANACEVAPNR